MRQIHVISIYAYVYFIYTHVYTAQVTANDEIDGLLEMWAMSADYKGRNHGFWQRRMGVLAHISWRHLPWVLSYEWILISRKQKMPFRVGAPWINIKKSALQFVDELVEIR